MKAAIPPGSRAVYPPEQADLLLMPKVGTGSTAPSRRSKKALKMLARYARKGIGRILPAPAQHFARQALSILIAVKARVQLTVGVQPLSPPGYGNPGTSINRYYLEQFLEEFSSDISGHCLEFLADHYTSRFGGDKVTKLDILHREPGNKRATIVADLTEPNNLPSDRFDCIICTYVLHSIFDLDKAFSELYRILKPGGVLLVAVPGYNMTYEVYHPLWLLTPEGLHRFLVRVFGAENISVHTYGNSLTAAGYLRGLTTHEFTKAELNYHTLEFAVAVFARACKQG